MGTEGVSCRQMLRGWLKGFLGPERVSFVSQIIIKRHSLIKLNSVMYNILLM